MGKASPPYDVQIVDDEGNILPPGAEGNVAVRVRPARPFCFFNCYLDNPEKTAASEQGDFYITGDRARMDKDGYFWFMGRNDDVINSARSSCVLFSSPFEASWGRGGHMEESVFLFQLPDRARRSGKCPCRAPSCPGVCCGQQPRPHQRRGSKGFYCSES